MFDATIPGVLLGIGSDARDIPGSVERLLNGRAKPLRIAGILPTFYDLRTHVSEELLETLRGRFTRILSPIRINVALAEAPAAGQTIFEFDGSSRGAVDYALLAEDLKLA